MGASRTVALFGASVVITCAFAFGGFEGLFAGGEDHPAIEYRTRLARDTVAALNLELRQGMADLKFEDRAGYLRSVLAALDVPIESQIVVFSKTSLMQHIIRPTNPRSVFFNDFVAVAWVLGEPFVELAAQDPRQGIVFYTLAQTPASQPQFVRRDGCLNCHLSYASLGVPGTIVRSIFPASDGSPIRQLGEYRTDHRSPFTDRWGGWYVTGKEVTVRHMGNAFFTSQDEAAPPRPVQGQSLQSLTERFDTSAYLSPFSDVVALMVFEHEMHAMNLLTRVGWEIRFALYQSRIAQRVLDKPAPEHNAIGQLLSDAAKELVDYFLFIDEAPIGGTIQGSSGFDEKFSAKGPHDAQGRSLRQFDLKRRLMRYPCSYMIYSKAFDSLPDQAREAVYKRMWQILSGQEKGDRYARLAFADRRDIVEILLATKMGLPDYFKPITR